MMRRVIKFWLTLFICTYITIASLLALFLVSTLMSRLATPAWPAEPDYSLAVSKAQEAFLIQSGIQANINKFSSLATSEVRGKAYSLIGRELTDTAAFSAFVLYKKEVSVKKFSDPFLPGVEHALKAAPGQALLSTTWRF